MKIFISSTYEDLKEYRRAVRDAILRLGHQPIGMEDFGSRPEEWNKAALDALNDCAALVGIYAHRYGTIPQGDTLSITEQEFDKARALGIPCFCYRVDPDYPWQKKFVDRGRAEKNLQRFLNKVDALLRSTFTTPDDLAKKVSADLGRELKPKLLTTLHSIPPPLPDFIGRAHEIEQLVTALTKPASHVGAIITGVAGMGGIGKTQLAYVVAHKIAAHYPDAHILVDCRGTSKSPPSPSELMRQVIQTFEPTADLRQATDAEIAALYCSLLNGKRALILLDNVADAAQVKPLLPPPGCALLITSRRYVTLPGLQPLRLDVLSPAEALALLQEICPRLAHASVAQARDEIARLCGYLPLALRIAASTLAAHPDLTPARYIERLRAQRLKVLKSPDDPEGNVEATLESSYQLLSADWQTRWRALAVFPASFDVSAAASVWNVDADTAFDTLSELVRLSLLDYRPFDSAQGKPPTADKNGGLPSVVGGRYYLHDLLRDLADARLSDTERDTAHL
ncbi:MAG: DUF4062 domain-containing protein, partial [Anaerolineae bacterium]|nr:DUF4062 domain-containing protein [Anaerolineae bacterium]